MEHSKNGGCPVSAAQLVTRLAQQGIDPELLGQVAQELFAGEAAREAIDKRRKNDCERQARRSREVTLDDVSQREVTERVSLDKEMPPIPPKEIKPFPCVKRTRAKHPLPANWQPMDLKPEGQAGQIVARKPSGWIERQLSKFKDHALQNNRQCSDWDAAWRNWIKQADEYDERTNTLGRHQSTDGLSPTTRAARAVFGIGAGH
jgi:hypothetical protein